MFRPPHGKSPVSTLSGDPVTGPSPMTYFVCRSDKVLVRAYWVGLARVLLRKLNPRLSGAVRRDMPWRPGVGWLHRSRNYLELSFFF